MRGLPGAGKSTFVANTFMGNDNINIICPDQLRNEERKRLMKKYIHQLEPINEHKIWKTAYTLLGVGFGGGITKSITSQPSTRVHVDIEEEIKEDEKSN